MKALLALFPFIVLGIIGGGTVSGTLVALAVSNSSVYVVSSSGYLYVVKPYSPANVIGYVGNASSIFLFHGSIYILKGNSLYLFQNHSLHFLTKISSFHPPYYVKNGTLYLLGGKKIFSGAKYFFHGSLALCIKKSKFYLFLLEKRVMSGTLNVTPVDFYYNQSLYLLANSSLYVYHNGVLSRMCQISNAFFIYYSNSTRIFLRGYEYNGNWNVSLLEIVSKASGKLLKVIPCSWFHFPYALTRGRVIDVRIWRTISNGVIKADFNGKTLVMLHENSTLEIFSERGRGWAKLNGLPALIRAVGDYCFAYFVIVSHKMSYIAIYAPSHIQNQKKSLKMEPLRIPTLPALIFLGALIGLGLLGYYLFRKRRLFFFLPFFPLRLSEANKAIRPIAPAAPTIMATSLIT